MNIAILISKCQDENNTVFHFPSRPFLFNFAIVYYGNSLGRFACLLFRGDRSREAYYASKDSLFVLPTVHFVYLSDPLVEDCLGILEVVFADFVSRGLSLPAC